MSFADVIEKHPSFTTNKAGDHIRCDGEECRTIIDLGSLPAEQLYFSHLALQLSPVDEELNQLRGLLARIPVMLSKLPELTLEIGESEALRYIASELDAMGVAAGLMQAPSTEDPCPLPALPAADIPTPAQEPKEEKTPMAAARRDVKALTAAVEPIKKGDRVAATFKAPRYGNFTVEGTVVKAVGPEHRQFNIGSWLLSSEGKPSKFLQSVEILAVAGEHEHAIVPGSDAPEHIGQGS